MLMVPERASPVLAVTEYETVPLPVPLAPPVTVSHDGSLLVALQEQVVMFVVTVSLPAAAPLPCERLAGTMV